MKHIKNIAWGALVALTLGYCLFCLADCGDKPVVVAPPVVVDTITKPIVRVVPDSEYCKSIAPYFAQSRAVGVRGKYWDNGTTLKIKLMGGTAQQRAYFTNAVLEWQKYINLNVSYVTTGSADIRVSFVSGSGSWSYCGTEAKSVPQNQATLNLGWLGSDVAAHEFAHAIGGAHEQSSPNSNIDWNKPVVYAALAAPPNGWSKETVDWNVFRKLTPTESEATVYDPLSILQYSVPGSWTFNYPNGIPGGKVLSAQDIAFWSEKYPKAAPPPPPPSGNVTITRAQADSIKTATDNLNKMVGRILK